MNTATKTTRKYEPYPEYRDSGVEWLGNVPEDWEVKRLKRCVDLINQKTDGNDIYLPYIGLENIESWTGRIIENTEGYKPEAVSNLFEPSDILFGKLRPYLAKAIAPNFSGQCSSELLVLRPRDVNQKYLLYYCLSDAFVKLVDSSTYGAKMPRASWTCIGMMNLPKPNADEQQAIADFLNRRTGEIDDLIAKKERVIELLKEKRTAIISHAVTKGLNPDAKMKNSGVDWLGKVPKHWELKRLKRVSKRIQTGCTPPTAQEYYYENGTISWYGPGNFGDDLILGEASKLINESAIKDGVARLFEAGSTMIVAIGATIGKVGYIDKPASSNQQITAVAPNIAKVLGKFLAYQLKRLEQVLKGIAPNTTLPIMDQQKIGCLVVAIPPISEQQAIADFLDRETAKIDALIAKVAEAIEKLKEYRTALISAAVTGKIDVREKIN